MSVLHTWVPSIISMSYFTLSWAYTQIFQPFLLPYVLSKNLILGFITPQNIILGISPPLSSSTWHHPLSFGQLPLQCRCACIESYRLWLFLVVQTTCGPPLLLALPHHQQPDASKARQNMCLWLSAAFRSGDFRCW